MYAIDVYGPLLVPSRASIYYDPNDEIYVGMALRRLQRMDL